MAYMRGLASDHAPHGRPEHDTTTRVKYTRGPASDHAQRTATQGSHAGCSPVKQGRAVPRATPRSAQGTTTRVTSRGPARAAMLRTAGRSTGARVTYTGGLASNHAPRRRLEHTRSIGKPAGPCTSGGSVSQHETTSASDFKSSASKRADPRRSTCADCSRSRVRRQRVHRWDAERQRPRSLQPRRSTSVNPCSQYASCC